MKYDMFASNYKFTIRGHAISFYDENEDELYILRICSCGEKDIVLYFLKDEDYGIVLKAGDYYHNGKQEIMDEVRKELTEFLSN
jgi:hypothetical protein